MINKAYLILIIAVFCGTEIVLGQVSPVKYETSYVGEMVDNFHGGIKQGTAYLGMANISLSLDTKNAGLWDGGVFLVNAAGTHGGNPSGDLIGDYQGISNIEAGLRTYIQELWFKQTIGRISLIAGMQDLGSEFAVNEYGALLINSSFGVHSTLSHNIPAPIFPYSTLAAQVHWNASDNSIGKLAVFNGQDGDGALLISEFGYTAEFFDDLPGTFTAGAYYHNHLTQTGAALEDGTQETSYEDNYGMYLVAGQVISKNLSGGKLVLFSQLGISPYSRNDHNFYFGSGINCYGLFECRPDDAAGLAVAHAGFYSSLRKNETTIEMTYMAQITQNIFVQPDIQYIINPAGTDEKLKNTFAGIVRFGVSF